MGDREVLGCDVEAKHGEGGGKAWLNWVGSLGESWLLRIRSTMEGEAAVGTANELDRWR